MIQHTMMDYPLNLPALLERAGILFPRVEVVSRLADRSVHRTNYGAVLGRARRLAVALRGLGLEPGDRVATLMWNHYAHLEAYFGVPMAGGVLHTLNLRLAPDDIAYIANHAQDRFLIVDDVLLPLLAKFRANVPFERVIVVSLGAEPVAGDLAYEDVLAGAEGPYTPLPVRETDAVAMCYTSGTTGRPKGVVYSHRALVLHSFAAALRDGPGIGHRGTVMPIVPMFHVNAWGIPFTASLVGAKLVLPGPYLDPVSLLDLMAGEGVTLAAGVPTIWLGVVQAYKNEPGRWPLSPWLTIVSGGAATPESLWRDIEAMGARGFHGWGMTETSPIGSGTLVKRGSAAEAPGDPRYRLLLKQGLPLPFVEVRIVNDAGIAPWDGATSGELQLRGPWVAGAYHGGEDAEKWTADGWFATGDVATIDPEGYIELTDRAKDLIKSGGEWISSLALEGALMDHPAVKEAAVVAVPHPKWQERPLAAVVLRDGQRVTADDLTAHLAPRFARWWLPDAYVFLDQIPRTSTGKFHKIVLRERYKTWEWAPPGG